MALNVNGTTAHSTVRQSLSRLESLLTLVHGERARGRGEGTDLVATWVEFPSLLVKELPQRYERLGERQWRYRSGTFSAVLDVDEQGLVLDYADVWRAVAQGASVAVR